ncbi:MAG: polysaccharide deacetylase family protein [Chloroflexota bacterium]
MHKEKNPPISNGLVGWLFIFFLVTVMGLALYNSQQSEASGEEATAVSYPPALAMVTETETAVPTDSATQSASNTPTSEPTMTSTTAATQPMTAVPSQTPIVTPLPLPTATATATPPTLGALPTPPAVMSWTLRVPILMYHYISVPPPDADIYRVDLSVHPDNFRAQMAYLAENGYTTVDLYDLSRTITNRQELPEKPVIITIDDGYLDAYENAFPILQEYGMTATIFVITELVDREHPGYATWPMLKEMAEAGIRIEPHSKTHSDLSGRGRDFLIWEILGSQQTVAAHIGYTPRYFAYPGGRYDENTIQILRELDFWGSVTTLGGRWNGFDDRYEWRRMRVRYTTSLPEFIDLVHPAHTRHGKALDGSSGP